MKRRRVKELKVSYKGDRQFTILIDDEDFPLVNGITWHIHMRKGRVTAVNGYCPIKKRTISIHQLIMGFPPSRIIDHKNGDPLDNRKANLRLATYSQNGANRQKQQGNTTSCFKGVHRSSSGKYRAKIQVKGEGIDLGTYDSEREAAEVYDIAATYNFGRYAKTNFPVERGEDWVKGQYLLIMKRLKKKPSSRYRGVTCLTLRSGRKRWLAQIHKEGKTIPIGRFDSEIKAAIAYDRAAKKYHGSKAVQNFSRKTI